MNRAAEARGVFPRERGWYRCHRAKSAEKWPRDWRKKTSSTILLALGIGMPPQYETVAESIHSCFFPDSPSSRQQQTACRQKKTVRRDPERILLPCTPDQQERSFGLSRPQWRGVDFDRS